MTYADDDVDCIEGEVRVGAMVGGDAVFTGERPDVGSNRAVAASAGDSFIVSEVPMEGEGRFKHACNRFGDAAVVKTTPMFGGSSGSATSLGDMR